MVHVGSGKPVYQAYGESGQAIFAMRRSDLQRALLETVMSEEKIRLHLGQKCLSVDVETPSLVLEDVATGKRLVCEGDLVIGADGAASVVRQAMRAVRGFESELKIIGHAYKELNIPAPPDGRPTLAANALHIWPRRKYMLIALPGQDGGFAGTLFMPKRGPCSFEGLKTETQVREFLEQQFPDCREAIPSLEQQMLTSPVSDLCFVQCSPWSYKDKIMLIGDAAHAILPFYGQGMVCGLEDCLVLEQFMDQFGDDWAAVSANFSRERKLDSDAINQLAHDNLIEMQDHIADAKFLLRKQLERAMHEWAPTRFTPIYTMIAFSDRPYREALENARWVNALMEEVMAIPHIEAIWQTGSGRARILRVLDEWCAPAGRSPQQVLVKSRTVGRDSESSHQTASGHKPM